jgi:hypothetical protein
MAVLEALDGIDADDVLVLYPVAPFTLAEDVESYNIQIFEEAAVKRTLTSGTTSVLYTTDQQIADWGALLGPGDTLGIRIFQLSNRLGRGDPATVTLQF